MLPLKHQNKLREQYQQKHPGWRTSGEIYQYLVYQQIKQSGRVLDLGCGRGGLSEKLSNMGIDIDGIDIDFQSLQNHRNKTIQLYNGDSNTLPFKSNSYTTIISSWTLEHLQEPLRTFQEINRILKPGGSFIFLTPHKNHPIVLANMISKIMPTLQNNLVKILYDRDDTDTFPVYYLANTEISINQLTKKAGLRSAQIQIIKDPTYLAFNQIMFKLSVLLEKIMSKNWGIHLIGTIQKPNH